MVYEMALAGTNGLMELFISDSSMKIKWKGMEK